MDKHTETKYGLRTIRNLPSLRLQNVTKYSIIKYLDKVVCRTIWPECDEKHFQNGQCKDLYLIIKLRVWEKKLLNVDFSE